MENVIRENMDIKFVFSAKFYTKSKQNSQQKIYPNNLNGLHDELSIKKHCGNRAAATTRNLKRTTSTTIISS